MPRFLCPSLLAAALVASPALAQPRIEPRVPDLDAAGAALSNPLVQDGLATMIGQVAEAFLQTRVGPLATLSGPRANLRPDDTLGDLVRRDDPGFDRRLRADTRRSLALTGRALQGAGAISRELQATADRLRAALAPLDGD